MSDDSSIDAVIEDLKDLAERAGDRVGEETEIQTDDGRRVRLFQCHHGNHGLIVSATEGEEHAEIRYQFALVDALARHRLQEEIDAPEGVEIQVDEDVFRNEMEIVMKDLRQVYEGKDDEDVARLRFTLISLLADPGNSYQLQTLDDDWSPIGFQITRKIYARKESFNVEEFHRASQHMVNVGIPSKIALMNSFGMWGPEGVVLDTSSDSFGPEDDDDDPIPGIE